MGFTKQKGAFDIATDYEECSEKYFLLFLHENICCGYSLEASNEYPQYVFKEK